jgi:hypothetical protein
VSEILLLSDILRVDTGALLTYSDEQEPLSEGGLFQHLTVNTFVYLLIILVLGAGVIWYTTFRSTESDEVVADTEEIIPIDSLNKLNDSLTRAVLDSTKLRSDSLISLIWPKGTLFEVPKNSVVVGLHQYLSDSTQIDAIELEADEIQFNDQTDLLDKPVNYVFMRMAEGLNRYKDVSIKIVVNSDKDERTSLKRGFVLKNRFVGEGLSPARIEVKTGSAKKVVFGILKKPLLK